MGGGGLDALFGMMVPLSVQANTRVLRADKPVLFLCPKRPTSLRGSDSPALQTSREIRGICNDSRHYPCYYKQDVLSPLRPEKRYYGYTN